MERAEPGVVVMRHMIQKLRSIYIILDAINFLKYAINAKLLLENKILSLSL